MISPIALAVSIGTKACFMSAYRRECVSQISPDLNVSAQMEQHRHDPEAFAVGLGITEVPTPLGARRQEGQRSGWDIPEEAYPSEPGLTTCWVCGCRRQDVRLMFCHAQPLEIRPPDVPRRLRGALSR